MITDSNPFARLSKRLKKAQGFQRKAAAEVLRGYFMVVAEDAITHTPVDTGETRSNWHVGRTSGVHEPHEPYSPYPRMTREDREHGVPSQRFQETANADAAIAAARAALAEFTDREISVEVPIYLSGTEVATYLNEGLTSSTQQDPGFVDRAIEKGRIWVRQQKGWSGFKDFDR